MVKTLLKYNGSAPRYTSYPPANLLTSAQDDSQVASLWKASNDLEPQNLSFYFHVPFCPKRCHFCGCNSEVSGSPQSVDVYFQALRQEMDSRLEWINPSRPLTQIHFGGGTPNAVPTAYLEQCISRLHQQFSFARTAEIAIECNPAHLSRTRLQEMAQAGFNRISIGIQDFNLEVLKAIGRDPSAYPVPELLADCRQLGFQGINLDLVYGLPGQNLDSFIHTVGLTIKAQPDRVALFSYAHVPWAKENQRHMDGLPLPGAEQKVEMFLAARDLFMQAGYLWVGMDHFVRVEDPLGLAAVQGHLHRNFQGYCERSTTGQVYGFGCSAISQLDNAYIQNIHASSTYAQHVLNGKALSVRCHVLTPQEKRLRDAIAQLMCNGVLDYDPVLDSASEGGWNRLCALSAENLLTVQKDQVRVTEMGRLVVRYLAMQLDPLMQNKERTGFSQTL